MRFIQNHFPNVINEHPPFTMYQLILKYKIPPLRLARYCCRELKERGGRGRVRITGIRSEESPRRAKRPQIDQERHVIKDWSAKDVWQYIRENHLPYCELYDQGFTRIGCVLCPFQNYEQTQRDLDMFPAIADYYRRACRKSFAVHRAKIRNWHSGDDMFDWWINERRGYTIAEDCNSIPLFSEDDGSVL